MALPARAYPSVLNMKLQGVSLLTTGYDASPSQGHPPLHLQPIYQASLVFLLLGGENKVFCPRT